MLKTSRNEIWKHKEKDSETEILEWLNMFRGGFAMKMEMGGRPVMVKGRPVLIPFKNKFYRTGVSDILFFFRGACFAFEVKTPEELNWYIKNEDKLRQTPLETIPKGNKKHRFKRQQLFLDDMSAAGHVAAFVDSLDAVQKVCYRHPVFNSERK